MQNAIVTSGRLTGPRSVELDEPVAELQGEVEVILRPRRNGIAAQQSITDFLRGLPPGTRTRDQIDQQLHQERDAWEDRA